VPHLRIGSQGLQQFQGCRVQPLKIVEVGRRPNWQRSVRRRDWRGTRPDQPRHYQGTDESVCVVVDRSRPPTEWRQPADRLARCRRAANCAGYAKICINVEIGYTSEARRPDLALRQSFQWSKAVGDLESLSATIWVPSCPAWVIFQSVESPNLRPPPGRPETDRTNSDALPAVWFARRIRIFAAAFEVKDEISIETDIALWHRDS
jgi:hypothetical protein